MVVAIGRHRSGRRGANKVWKIPNEDPETVTILSATAHWRWQWTWFLLDVGAGPALSFDSYRYAVDDSDVPPGMRGRITRSTCVGIHTDVGTCGVPLDLALSLGVSF